MKVLDKNVNIELLPATVMQIDRYARTGTFTDDNFFPLNADTAHINIIFKLKNTNKILPLDIRDMQLPLYKKQEVDIISANELIIGYVDVKNEEYYYVTTDFCKAIGIGIPGLFIWLIGILGALFITTVFKNDYAVLIAFLLLISTWMLHLVLKFELNKKIETAIDEFMKSVSQF